MSFGTVPAACTRDVCRGVCSCHRDASYLVGSQVEQAQGGPLSEQNSDAAKHYEIQQAADAAEDGQGSGRQIRLSNVACSIYVSV